MEAVASLPFVFREELFIAKLGFCRESTVPLSSNPAAGSQSAADAVLLVVEAECIDFVKNCFFFI